MNIVEQSVPLFETKDGRQVYTREIGSSRKRNVLCRSREMEKIIIQASDELTCDWEAKNSKFDGIIYLMFCKRPNGGALPLYIGKTEKYGKNQQNLSVNIKNLANDRNKFARWGDNYQYHIGDLSSVVLGHSGAKKPEKYQRWANKLFVDFPVTGAQLPELKNPIYFWCKNWQATDVGPWEAFGPTNLTFLEYLLIGVASSAYPNEVLNVEGQNRN